MLKNFSYSLLLILFSLTTVARAETPFWRAVWEEELVDKDDEPLKGEAREKYLKLLEDAYGAQLYVMPKREPEEPKKVKGVFYHDSIYDEGYVKGDTNPQLLTNEVIEAINKKYKLEDLDEKWNEFQFLEEFLPKDRNAKHPRMAPPEMHLATDYTGKLSKEERKVALKKYEELLEKFSGSDAKQKQLLKITKASKEKLIKLFTIQDRINKAPGMGKSILKIRTANHSEGKLPKTDKDWGELYVHYVAETKKLINKDTSPEELLEMKFVEGRILERLLGARADDVIVQHMVKIKKEMRMHIVNGEILEGATFLRFYKVNEYLKDEDIEKVHAAVRKDLLPALKKAGFGNYSGSPDAAILEDGSVVFLDFNDGLYSGYLMPTEDLFTTNLFAQKFTGKPTTFLREFEDFKSKPWGEEKALALKRFRNKYKQFMTGDVTQSFWDRINKYIMQELAKNPTPEQLKASLELMKAGGLRRPLIETHLVYMQFLAEVQDRWPNLVMSKKDAQEWVDFINGQNPPLDSEQEPKEERIAVSLDGTNHIRAVSVPDEPSKALLGDAHYSINKRIAELKAHNEQQKASLRSMRLGAGGDTKGLEAAP